MHTQGNHTYNPYNIGSENTHYKPVRCANCDIDILWPPIVAQGKKFCCTGCAVGGPCNCDYSQYRSVNISGIIHYGVHLDE